MNSAGSSSQQGTGSRPSLNSTPASGLGRMRLERHGWRVSNDIQPLSKYTPTPTSGTVPLHSSQDIGYTDFRPTKAGQSEDVLTEHTIRYGYTDMPHVENEFVSQHEMVYDRLLDTRVFQDLQAFAAGVAQRQLARGSVVQAALPRLPNRPVRSDEQRDEWMRNLANPRLPLSVLINTLPFGHRGERLLESLRQHNVPLLRAVWAIRLTGVYEMFGQQARTLDHAGLKALEQSYTLQWSKSVTQFLDHTLSTAPTANHDAMQARKWSQDWTYSLSLLHIQADQGLMDQRHLVSWLANQFRQLPVDKCMLVLPVIKAYVPEISKSRTPLRKLIQAVALRVEQAQRYPSLAQFGKTVCGFLVELFEKYPDAFVEPTTWWDGYRTPLYLACDKCEHVDRKKMKLMLAQVDERNAKFSSLVPSTVSGSKPRSDHSAEESARTLHVLNEINIDTSVSTAFDSVFASDMVSPETVDAHKIRLICYWVVDSNISPSATQFRTMFGTRLIQMHKQQLPDTSSSALQLAIVSFLDIFTPSDACSGDDRYVWRVCLLLERLSYANCFSVPKYLQMLTARGDFFGANVSTIKSQRHLAYTKSLAVGTPEDEEQRQMLLYGFEMGEEQAAQSDSDGIVCVNLRREVSRMLPFLVAYTCATLVRARANGKESTIDVRLAMWWRASEQESSVLDRQNLPTPEQLAGVPLAAPSSRTPCVKDWISPLTDHISDESLLSQDISPECLELLNQSSRNILDIVVHQRLMPIVYDYVVKDIKVGVDNWRVITQPGTSLLNARQTATIIRILSASGMFAHMLDFLLWLLNHSKATPVLATVHTALVRFTDAWRLLGRLTEAATAVGQIYTENSSPSSIDLESFKTLSYWSTVDPADTQIASLAQKAHADYDAYVDTQAQSLLLPSHAAGPVNVDKELLPLAQRIVAERQRESAQSLDEINWAVSQCFDKLSRWASSQVSKSDFSIPPGLQPNGTASSPAMGGKSRSAKLQSVFAHVASSTTLAAISTARQLANDGTEHALLSCYLDLTAQYIGWFSNCFGLLVSPQTTSQLLLTSLATAINAWPMARNSTAAHLAMHVSSAAGASPVVQASESASPSPLFAVTEIDRAMLVASMWVTKLLASGCLRISFLVPWLIEELRSEVSQTHAAKYACLAGIANALAILPDRITQHRPSLAHIDSRTGSLHTDPHPPAHHLIDRLTIDSCWDSTLLANKVSRIQTVELVFTCASSGGQLRDSGMSQLETILVRAATALAQSVWVQLFVDYIPLSPQDASSKTMRGQHYNMLEIYRANIEAQIRSPTVTLPVKRAVLRSLLTLCEGSDPANEGFSAMTTPEVALRLRETLHRFWFGPAALGKTTPAAYKCATILNSLMLFSATALQETEATTDAFAVAAGAATMATAAHSPNEPTDALQDIDSLSQALGHGSEQVQFVTNPTTFLAGCALEAVFNWGTLSREAKDADSVRYASLADVLSTLDPTTLLQQTAVCWATLFKLNIPLLRATSDQIISRSSDGSPVQRPRNSNQQDQSPSAKAALEIIRSVRQSVSSMVATGFGDIALTSPDAFGEMGGVERDALDVFAARGSALTGLTQQLMLTLAKHAETLASKKDGAVAESPFGQGTLLASVRAIACGLIGQLQAISAYASPDVAAALSLASVAKSEEPTTANTPQSPEPPAAQPEDAEKLQPVDPQRLRLAISWRLQALQPMCGLMRVYPEEFAADEWLMTLVTLCLSPLCQSAANGAPPSLYQYLLDFSALTNEGITAAMRKRSLVLMRRVAPLVRAVVPCAHFASTLSRLFPFESANVLTCDLPPTLSAHTPGLDNPWIWVEALEFTPLSNLSPSAPINMGLEGMTPYTLRGALEAEEARKGVKRAGENPNRLAFLDNPYYPKQPAFMAPLSETPIPWQAFGGKRRRMDAETRLVWRNQCQQAFGENDT